MQKIRCSTDSDRQHYYHIMNNYFVHYSNDNNLTSSTCYDTINGIKVTISL